jgi:hypothetical protein
MKTFVDTVHFSTVNHYGVVLDSEGFILAKTAMFRTKQQAWDNAAVIRDRLEAQLASPHLIEAGGFVANI